MFPIVCGAIRTNKYAMNALVLTECGAYSQADILGYVVQSLAASYHLQPLDTSHNEIYPPIFPSKPKEMHHLDFRPKLEMSRGVLKTSHKEIYASS